ncbi:hypothetical protein AB0H49_05190 [Nocardia sp. NPDC050713]|uniref:hypothetical protein n=1 Tax=Nocardia sp. NPDC050713 TaxID=3154511 RepID=UPI0033C55061
MTRPELNARPQWRRTGNAKFPVAAVVDGSWWVLRLNGFPDHPLWTLFVDGTRRFDVDDAPSAWRPRLGESTPLLDSVTAEKVVAPIRRFVAYGSEVGDPCDNPFCCG